MLLTTRLLNTACVALALLLVGCLSSPPREDKPVDPNPAFGASNECETSADCTGEEEKCYSPTHTNCGHPDDAECYTTNDHCDEGMVCEPAPGPCRPADAGRCVADCRTAGCDDGERCVRKTRLCVPIRCDKRGASPCPAYHECVDGLGAEIAGCDRLTCETDEDCGAGGTCWRSECFDRPAVCEPPAP